MSVLYWETDRKRPDRFHMRKIKGIVMAVEEIEQERRGNRA